MTGQAKEKRDHERTEETPYCRPRTSVRPLCAAPRNRTATYETEGITTHDSPLSPTHLGVPVVRREIDRQSAAPFAAVLVQEFQHLASPSQRTQ